MSESEVLTLRRPLRAAKQSTLPFDDSVDAEPGLHGEPFLRWAGGKTRLLGALLPWVRRVEERAEVVGASRDCGASLGARSSSACGPQLVLQ